jgi:hypothetical protein
MHDKFIRLTKQELKTLSNTEFFTYKKRATEKIQKQFHLLKEQLHKEIDGCKNIIPDDADTKTGRIFKGENYKGLPYIVLDYPRLFNKYDVFSFRNMCLWGSHYSFTLHISGTSLNDYRNLIAKNIHHLKGKGFYYCVNSSPWEYHYEKDNYWSLDDLIKDSSFEIKENIQGRDFIKLSRKLDIHSWDEILKYGTETFGICIDLLKG